MSWEALGGILGAIAFLYTAFRVPAIERLKGDLQREHARFSTTYGRQMDVIAELYEKLASVEEAAYQLTKPFRTLSEPTEEQAREHLIREFEALRWFFTRRRLFLPKQVASDVSDLISQIRKTSQDFIWMREEEDAGRQSERIRKWGDIHEEITTDVPKVREGIEDKFRELLGLE